MLSYLALFWVLSNKTQVSSSCLYLFYAAYFGGTNTGLRLGHPPSSLLIETQRNSQDRGMDHPGGPSKICQHHHTQQPGASLSAPLSCPRGVYIHSVAHTQRRTDSGERPAQALGVIQNLWVGNSGILGT